VTDITKRFVGANFICHVEAHVLQLCCHLRSSLLSKLGFKLTQKPLQVSLKLQGLLKFKHFES